jgi:Fe-S-cluster-containing hydrogenase component 2
MCCGCCCFILRGAKKLPCPKDYYNSNYFAQTNQELCNGCATCVDLGGRRIIKKDDGKSSVNLDRCLGCGNCIITCKTGAMTLEEQEEIFTPTKTHMKLFLKFVKNKYGTLGTLKMLGKYLIGRKV